MRNKEKSSISLLAPLELNRFMAAPSIWARHACSFAHFSVKISTRGSSSD
jgi:hypothetical protein